MKDTVQLIVLALLLIAGRRDDLPALARVAPPTVALREPAGVGRAPRFLRAAVLHHTNSHSTWNTTRLICCGDVELNPGPDTAPGGGAGSVVRSTSRERCRSITLHSQNMQSIRGKLGALRATAPALSAYSILALTETWLDSTVLTAELQYAMPDHSWFRKDRGTRGGGVACAVNTNLHPHRREDLEKDTCELLAVELRSFPRIIFMVCYCPPSAPGAVTEVMALIQRAVHSNPNFSFLISGDFNIPSISWRRSNSGGAIPITTRTCRRAADFLEACQMSLLKQHVYQPTRGQNVLDLVLSSAHLRVDTTVQDGLISSDHREVICEVAAAFPSVPLATRKTALNYKRADWDGLRRSLRMIPWDVLLDSQCVDINTDRFYCLLEGAIRDCIPTVTLHRSHPPWFDRDLRRALLRKEAAFRKKHRDPTPETIHYFSEARRFFKNLSCKKFSEYLRGLAGDFRDNPKRFWTYVKCVRGGKKGPTVLLDGNKSVTGDTERANLLNRVFAAKFTAPHTGPLPVSPQYDLPMFNAIHIPNGTLLRILESVQPNKACGPDNLSARIIKECACELAVPMTILCRQSVNSGTFPKKWKEANIVPVHKKGSARLASNYRSISLLPLFGKVLERAAFECILKHVRPVLSDKQHGFVPHRSCDSNLSTLLRAGWDAISDNTQLDCIYTDYSAAFQSVNHRLLLHKLENGYHFKGSALSWIRSFLMERRQRVVLNGHTSDWISVTSGTPEGSQISPLLFSLYINDLPRQMTTNCLMYADDVKLYYRIRNASDAKMLQADLDRLVQWSTTWRLDLNASKCNHLSITLKRVPVLTSYNVRGEVLKEVDAIRDLGVIIDRKLTFQAHVDHIVKKANRALGVLIRTFQTGRSTWYERKSFIAAYCANVRSVLEFCSVVWGGAAKIHTDRIERVQHKFLMWLSAHTFGAPQTLDYNRLLSHFSLCSLGARRTQLDLAFLARVFKDQIDSCMLRSCFGLAAPSHPTRQLVLFSVPYARVETVKSGLFCRLPRELNEFLRKFPDVDFFADSLFAIKSKAKMYAKMLTDLNHLM